ncbi:MAG TPA: DUF2232 domain-containing protein [bacterium]|nr:DUF2232 domain-containing protein [bacterium]
MALSLLDLLINLALVAVVFIAAGLASAWALLKGLSSRWAVLAGALGAAAFVAVFFFATGPEVSGFSQLEKDFEAGWAAQTPLLLKSGLTPETVELVKGFALKYFLFSLPAWVVVGCLMAGLLSYYLASSILRRITLKVGQPLAFRLWVLPEFLIFGFIAGCCLKLFAPENSPGDIWGDNLLVFFTGFYALGGLSIVSFYFHKWRLSLFWRAVNYFLMFQFSLQTAALLSCLGILDVWFDLRKVKAIPTGENNP